MKHFILLIFIAILCLPVFSQPSNAPIAEKSSSLPKVGTLKGKIVDSNSNTPLEYANVAIFSVADSSLIGGGITDSKGMFNVSGIVPGDYFLTARFIGYDQRKVANIKIGREIATQDLGVIKLNLSSNELKEFNVTSSAGPIKYEIDKKIIDPSQFPAAANGTAVDILANTPSVVVDIEGNVSLRGSSSFTVLIDGRPTPFSAADALEQMPASVIRNIEIITNPSAKYDPDGNAGIININTKKSKITGISGIVNGSADSFGSISGDFLLNFKKDKFNYFISANKSNRKGSGEMVSLNKTFSNGDTTTIESLGKNGRNFDSWSVKTGVDYYINDKNTLSFNVNLNSRLREMGGTNDFHQFSTTGYDFSTITKSSNGGKGENISLGLDYKKTFDKAGQELTAYLFYRTGNNEDFSFYNRFVSDTLHDGQKNWEMGDDNELRFKTDYVHPINSKTKIEAGYQARLSRSNEWNDVNWYTSENDYKPSSESEFYTESDFMRDIHSLYTTFNNAGEVVGYQLGVRSEYTNRSISYSGSSEPFIVNRLDFFPSAHISFQLSAKQQLTTSYTRRIQRPRGMNLEPFKTYMDAYNIRTGNPSILPEYIDSYELGYQLQLKGGFVSAEVYHRKTNNRIEQVQSVYAENVMLHSVANIGADYSTGLETMISLKPSAWWTFNIMGNAYHYRIESDNFKVNRPTSFNWNSRFSNTFNITKTTKLQFDGTYNSPTTTAQGRREGFMFTNMAVRQDFFNNKLNATFSVRDMLNTAKFGFESSGENFYSKRNMDQKSPIFALTLSYKINNYRQKSKSERGENGGESEGRENMMDMEGGF